MSLSFKRDAISMITRIFSVVVQPELQAEFEDKFENLALPDTLSAKGCSSVQIFKPTSCNPNTYLMISVWESVEALKNKFGANWHLASIPDFMKKYEQSHTIKHFSYW